ncbi:MAG TPA: R3H domain-containing nucleic acid-binding protein [Polyangiaceae bacterium]|nr:R3H domain-containing nucleic acid-binding protein [Polyangiaceae bacterium]
MPTPDEKNEELDSSWPEAADGESADVKSQAAEGAALNDDAGPREALADDADGDMEYDEVRAEGARDFVEDLMVKMGMDVEADLVEPEPGDPPGEIRIEIEGRDSGRIIGKKGQVLSAIQHIVNRVVNKPGLDRRHVVVDAEGYRQRREDTLATMAQRLGKKALEEGKIITFEPMSPRDRRIVHLALAKFPGVVTKSDGEGEGRRVQIIPVRR